MTEQEYINVKDLANTQVAIDALKKIIPEVSDVIKASEHQSVVLLLKQWEAKLYAHITAKIIT